jgi:hypothetical protein
MQLKSFALLSVNLQSATDWYREGRYIISIIESTAIFAIVRLIDSI